MKVMRRLKKVEPLASEEAGTWSIQASWITVFSMLGDRNSARSCDLFAQVAQTEELRNLVQESSCGRIPVSGIQDRL